MFRPIFGAHLVKNMHTREFILLAIGELDAIIGQNGMNMIGHQVNKIAQERRGGHLARDLSP